MRIALILLALSLVSCKNPKLAAVSDCGKTCWDGFANQLNKGVCRAGTWACDEEGNKTVCVGAVYPSAEICDGLDNDCNGLVDGIRQTCSTACGSGAARCELGIWSACTAPKPQAEICDGLDNDCDGIIDNADKLPVQFCYTGPDGTLSHAAAPCGPGLLRCSLGKQVCVGQTLPSPEVCDGIDNNCNGIVDDGSFTPTDLDIVFVIDDSGSMAGTIAKVQSVVIGFIAKYGSRADLRWALVAVPDRDQNVNGDFPTLQVDFTTPALFADAMNLQAATGSGNEATVDAIDELIDLANPLKLTWKAGAKKSIVIFSDEEPQAYFTKETTKTIFAKVQNLPGKPLADVVVFTDMNYFVNTAQWSSVVGGSSRVYSIDAPEPTIARNLENIIQRNSCR